MKKFLFIFSLESGAWVAAILSFLLNYLAFIIRPRDSTGTHNIMGALIAMLLMIGAYSVSG
jgi:hypothetical protein